ncbi:MAG: HAMP domain-containing protein, partial [Methanospirillaceae archaeon]|nr:HAMP domain-containing protein [Methanospirillaceae archaeon]
YYEPFDWIIASGSYLEDFQGPLVAIRDAIIISIIVSVLIGTFVALLFKKSIVTRMDRLRLMSERVRDGDFAIDTAMDQSSDEIGLVSDAFFQVVCTFQEFSREIRNLYTAAVAGDLSVRGDTGKYQGEYATLIKGVNEILDAVIHPIQNVMSLSSEYAKGNLSARMDEKTRLSGDFRSLQDAMNTIGTDISGIIRKIRTEMDEMVGKFDSVSSQVESVTEQIDAASHSSEDVSKGTEQIANISSVLSDIMQQSDNNVQQILSAMQDLSMSVTAVAGKIDTVSVITSQTADLADTGERDVRKAEEGMAAILTSSNETGRMVSDINQQMNEIGRIVDIIQEIAEQTNLLALNAAIEAARAGEAGLGFAVVASEVKELAGESQRSAENIGGIISSLQEMTKKIADAMEISLDKIQSGNSAVTDSLKAFSEIAEAITLINQNMNEVAAASEEQAASVEEVTATVNEFTGAIKKTTEEAVGLASASQESSASVHQIALMMGAVNTSMQEIDDAIGHAKASLDTCEGEMGHLLVD